MTSCNQFVEIIDDLQNEIVYREKLCHNIETLNGLIDDGQLLVLYVNIRSLNANFDSLQLFVEGLGVKPSVIVCVETRKLVHCDFFYMAGYKLYYNQGNINITDGVVMYIKDTINEDILNTCLQLNDSTYFEISAVYRLHDLPKAEFIAGLKAFLNKRRKVRNHLLVGDFNIDILENDRFSQKHLNNCLELGFVPGFRTITRPSVADCGRGSCIDNIFLKTNNVLTRAIELEALFNNHYPLFLVVNEPIWKPFNEGMSVAVDYGRLVKFASETNWTSIIEMTDPNLATETLANLISKCVEHARVKTRKHLVASPRSPWITKCILNSCNRKQMLYSIWIPETKDRLQRLC